MITIRHTVLMSTLAAALTLPAIASAQDAATDTTTAPQEQVAPAQTAPEQTAPAPMPGLGMRHGAMHGEGYRMHQGGRMGDGKKCMQKHQGYRMGDGAGMDDKRIDMLEKRMDMMQMMLEMLMKQQAPASSQ